MRKKALSVAIVAVVLSTAAIVYRTVQLNTYCIEDILAVYQEHADYKTITIEYPLNETLFPPEMIPPKFSWNDAAPASRAWLVRIDFADGKPSMHFLARRQQWTPRPEDWKNIKNRSLEQDAQVVVLGLGPVEPVRILSQAKMSFRTSKDPVGAPLFYREVKLPFLDAHKDLPDIRWRFGSIATP